MDVLAILDRYGLPTAVLAVVAAGIFLFARTVLRELIVPIRTSLIARAVAFFDKLDGTLDRMDQRDAKMLASGISQWNLLEEVRDDVREVWEVCTKMEALITKQAPRVRRPRDGQARHRPSPTPPPGAPASPGGGS